MLNIFAESHADGFHHKEKAEQDSDTNRDGLFVYGSCTVHRRWINFSGATLMLSPSAVVTTVTSNKKKPVSAVTCAATVTAQGC